jgi:hypothetical protein
MLARMSRTEMVRFEVCTLRGRAISAARRGKAKVASVSAGVRQQRREKHGSKDPPLQNSLFSDVFVPDSGIPRNIGRQHVDAVVRVEIDHLDAVFEEPVDAAAKVDGLAYD